MGAWHAFSLMLLLPPLVLHTVHTNVGDFVSLAALGGPAIGIKQALLQVITYKHTCKCNWAHRDSDGGCGVWGGVWGLHHINLHVPDTGRTKEILPEA